MISIIVASLDRSQSLIRCLKSIWKQTYPHRELIVMDGGSKDDTIEMLRAYDEKIKYWESKTDRGIYHAWNKALRHCQGEWICFLGSDDFLWNGNVLLRLSSHLTKAYYADIRIVYGQVARVDRSGHIIKILGRPWEKIRWLMPHGMPLPHPGLMHHKTLFKEHGPFDESFRIAGDYEFLLRELKTGNALFVEDLVTVGYEEGGIGDSKNLEAHLEILKARKKHGLQRISLVWLGVHFRNIFREVLTRLSGRYRRIMKPL